MSLADDAKILLIPSGYKTATPYGKLYSVFPIDGEQDFRIDRATTASRVNPGGLVEQTLADTPRVDHLGGGCPSVLIEPGRTNKIIQSENWGTSWSFFNGASISTNQTIAPDGTMTADKIVSNGTNFGFTRPSSNPVISTGNTTFSLFVKADNRTTGWLRLDYGTTIYNRKFDLTTQTFSTGFDNTGNIPDSEQIINYGNGWYRLIITDNANTTSFEPRIYVTGNTGSSANDSLFLWGAQIENGIGATSYIKTTTASVTRSIDNLECTTSYILGTDATFYFDFEAYSYDSSFRQGFMVRNSAFTQYIDFISYQDSGIYYFRARASANGGTQNYLIAFGERDIEFFQRNKVALRLYENNFEIYVNGSQMKTGTSSAGNFDVVDGISIVNDFGSSPTRPACKLYDFRVYDKTMTQSELETLTTI